MMYVTIPRNGPHVAQSLRIAPPIVRVGIAMKNDPSSVRLRTRRWAHTGP